MKTGILFKSKQKKTRCRLLRLKKVKGRLKESSRKIARFANKLAEVHGNRIHPVITIN